MAVILPASEELSKLRIEIRVVKAALRDGKSHLGMSMDALQEYFLQLNEKENLMLSRQLQSSEGAKCGAVVRPATACPDPIPAFDPNSLASVVEHMHICEANAQESGKALRALTSIAYASTTQVNADARVLLQILRLTELHASSEPVKLGAVQTICNMADDRDYNLVLAKLTERPVLVTLLSSLALDASSPAALKTVAKANEAVARIIAAAAELQAEFNAGVMPLTKLFTAALSTGDVSKTAQPITQICERLVENEVVGHDRIAGSLMNAFDCAKESASAAICWLEISKTLSGDKEQSSAQQIALVSTCAVGKSVQLMELFLHSESVQLSAIETLSALVGVVWQALDEFANAAGVTQIEKALREHSACPLLQLRGIRALSSGVAWPKHLQEKSGYSVRSTMQIAEAALAQHWQDVELATVALDALEKLCTTYPECIQELKADGGDEIVQKILASHPEASKLQRSARVVFGWLGKN